MHKKFTTSLLAAVQSLPFLVSIALPDLSTLDWAANPEKPDHGIRRSQGVHAPSNTPVLFPALLLLLLLKCKLHGNWTMASGAHEACTCSQEHTCAPPGPASAAATLKQIPWN